MAAETFEQWWERDGSRYEYPPQAAEEAWCAATKAAEERFTSTNTGMAASEQAQIAAEMNDVLQSGVLNHQAINWVTHWARQLRHA